VVERRYMHGLGVDEPLLWYEGSWNGMRVWLAGDRQGSIVAQTYQSGAL
jgi:hypothetical protein